MRSDVLFLVGGNIRRLRERAGISQEALADGAELHRTYIGGVERGERNVSTENLVRIARALHVRPAVLLKGVK